MGLGKAGNFNAMPTFDAIHGAARSAERWGPPVVRPGLGGDNPGPTAPPGSDRLELSPDGKRALQELKAIDQKVRSHEAAHQAAGAGLVRGASFSYRKGPDGQLYAVGGEVILDTGAVPGNPRATLAKMQQVQAAALAPADPSPQDRAVAAQAAATAQQARTELARTTMQMPAEKGRGLDLTG